MLTWPIDDFGDICKLIDARCEARDPRDCDPRAPSQIKSWHHSLLTAQVSCKVRALRPGELPQHPPPAAAEPLWGRVQPAAGLDARGRDQRAGGHSRGPGAPQRGHRRPPAHAPLRTSGLRAARARQAEDRADRPRPSGHWARRDPQAQAQPGRGLAVHSANRKGRQVEGSRGQGGARAGQAGASGNGTRGGKEGTGPGVGGARGRSREWGLSPAGSGCPCWGMGGAENACGRGMGGACTHRGGASGREGGAPHA